MKNQARKERKEKPFNHQKRNRYEAPAIIFEGRITTRAGTTLGNPDTDVDPADLFGG